VTWDYCDAADRDGLEAFLRAARPVLVRDVDRRDIEARDERPLRRVAIARGREKDSNGVVVLVDARRREIVDECGNNARIGAPNYQCGVDLQLA